MDIEFNNLAELYKRLEPALATKEADLKRNDYTDVSKHEIWSFLEVTKWKNAENLLLHEMVNDILNSNNEEVAAFAKETKE